ncbi:unnamed protein product [Trichogramma brassicae]|uniref:Uncharacterized protein n=1 Tax=Trichogramma brassicae TaxID=86971 RepID=A0A6H5HVF5_9HYME|nr:unnamed protein product [Trichogramma brassicae]
MYDYDYATHTMDDYDHGLLNKLKRLRQETNWEVKRERHRLSRKLYPLIKNWVNKLPDLREIFQQEEIEWLLMEDVKKLVIKREISYQEGRKYCSFLEFVSRTGYKDVPGVDEDGKPLLRRTTPLHYAARRIDYRQVVIAKLFEIYDSDANYTDESGFSHLHAACMTRQCRIVESFIQHGQDPNLVWPETDDTPLLLALRGDDYALAETLLRLGANPNLANAEGLTPLHVIIPSRVHRNKWAAAVIRAQRRQIPSAASRCSGRVWSNTVAHGRILQAQEYRRIAADKWRQSEFARRGWIDSSARHLQNRLRKNRQPYDGMFLQGLRRDKKDGASRLPGQSGPDTASIGSGQSFAEYYRYTLGSWCRSDWLRFPN